MEIQLIRHATLLVEFGDRRILVDPMLSDAGAMSPIPFAADCRRIPLTSLPMGARSIVEAVDAVVITHLHPDHLDKAATELLPKDLPLLCQPCDQKRLRALGFRSVLPVGDAVEQDGVEFIRTGGKHGTGLIGLAMGRVSGFVLRAPGEPTLYLAGDTIWCGQVREALETYRPDVVVLNAGAAQFRTGSPITMDGRAIAMVAQTAPDASVVAVHMDAINHCLLTRADLRADLASKGLLDRVRIPADGEVLAFP